MQPLRIYTYSVLSYGLGGLFIYAAAKKVKDYTAYTAHIEASELFTKATSIWVARGVIGIEMLLAILFIIPVARVQIWAWRGLPILMAVYSYYIYHILHQAPFVPCACKGVYEQLGWQGHYYLNAGLAILALLVCWMYCKWIKTKN